MDGFETARIIRQRQRTRHVPIIFVTGNDPNQTLVLEGYSAGAADYITKPYNPEILRSKVKVFVELWRRGEQIKNQQEQIHRNAILEAERREREASMRKVQEQVLALNSVLESRVAERTAQLVQANEEMEAFCYSVSHDLRTPLRGVIATSRILVEEAGKRLTPDEIELLERQASAAKRLGELIDDLLQLSRLGRKTLEKMDLDMTELAKTVANEMLSLDWPSPIEIVVEPGMRSYSDPGLTRLLLQNLLENACKYSPQGGTIYVASLIQDDVPVYFIRDEGIGFPMEYRHKVFLPFERLVLESEFPGTGIGLANAKRIIARHGGRIWAESVPHKGSTFFFTL
jgi:two-component system, sensor histidine kinase and response regulator